jgi:hypothetical protein
MVVPEDRLDLFLADADDHRPVLDEGLPGETSQQGPKPKGAQAVQRDNSFGRRETDAAPNDLPAQRWAVVAPEGKEGDRLLDAVAPLMRLRAEEQRADVITYRVPEGMDARRAVAWKKEVYWSEDVEEADRPLYLLVLGDLHHVSLELQHALANSALVGRAHFADTAGETDLDGYAAYAEKVVHFAREGTPERSPDLSFFVARDGTPATLHGEARLITPSLEAATRNREQGRLPAASVRALEVETVDELLAAGKGPRPSVLLSVSHGLGAPRRGWPSKHEQWQRQGALVLGQNEILDAERMLGQAFLPGGLWFCLACFGAGTPSESAYHRWLSQLAQESAYSGKASAVFASLPSSGQRSFVAAMPQAALRNPAGPLAVISHVDLAWTYAFSSSTDLSESRSLRIHSALEVMVRGSRAGVALEALMRFYRETNDELMISYEREENARAEGRADPTDRKKHGHLWMLRNDLRGYILLGDPAARLPLAQHTLGAEASAPAAAPEVRLSPANSADTPVAVKEAAVHALIRGAEAPTAIAARAGVSIETLWAWCDAYRAAGRAALGG